MRLLLDLALQGRALLHEVGHQLLERTGGHDRARDAVSTRRSSLLQDHDEQLVQLLALALLLVRGDEVRQVQRTAQGRDAAPHKEDIDLHDSLAAQSRPLPLVCRSCACAVSSVSAGTTVLQVAHHAVVGEGEDGRVRIAVDGHDALGALHARPVLDGAGDAAGDVELRRHGLARLPHLRLMMHPAGVDHRPAGAHRGAQRVGQVLDELEVLGTAHPAATGHHDGGLLEAEDARRSR